MVTLDTESRTFKVDYSEKVWQLGQLHIRVPNGFARASLSLQFGGEGIEGEAYFDDLAVRVVKIGKLLL